MEPTEVMFYHLTERPLASVLPALLERTLARGWRAVVQAGSEERVEALNQLLWTYSDDSFLPHGARGDGDPARQPVFVTAGDDNPNGAAVRFLVDGATIDDITSYRRIVHIFDGHDPTAVEQARGSWAAAKAAGCTVTYWQQSTEGRWEQKV